jgi:hypothetical protein
MQCSIGPEHPQDLLEVCELAMVIFFKATAYLAADHKVVVNRVGLFCLVYCLIGSAQVASDTNRWPSQQL